MILAEVSAPGLLEENEAFIQKKRKKKKVASRNGAAWTANCVTQQILVAHGAGDASKQAGRGCSSLHSAHS